MHAYSANSQQNFNMLVQDISYLKFSQAFLHKLSSRGADQRSTDSAIL